MRKPILRSLLCFTALFALAGCYGSAPSPMPRGYTSHGDTYKSAPGNDARDVGYEYSNNNNAAVLKDMRYAASDLAEKLDQHLSFSVDQVYLSIPANTAFYNSFDHLLRDELTQRGYLLAHENNKDSVPVELVAHTDVPFCLAENNDGPYKNLYLALAINVGKHNKPEHIVGDFYEVPTHDFIPAGNVNIKTPTCEGSKG